MVQGYVETRNQNGRTRQKLIDSLQDEVNNLRVQISMGRSTVPKDLALVSLIPKWSGTEKFLSVTEFFELVESSARIRN